MCHVRTRAYYNAVAPQPGRTGYFTRPTIEVCNTKQRTGGDMSSNHQAVHHKPPKDEVQH